MEENNNFNDNNIEVQENTTPVVEDVPKKKSNKVLIIVIVLLLICLGAGAFFMLNNKEGKEKTKDKEKETKTETKEFKSAYRMSGNGLQDFDLYFLKLENNEKNMLYSPLSIKYTLQMLADGSDGDSKKQLDAVIGDYVTAKYANNKNMSFANGLFIRDTYKDSISKDYIDKLKTNYNAEVVIDSFKDPKPLNDWVSNKTFKLINNLFNDLNEKDFILVNALAIDMEWVNKIRSVDDLYIVEYLHEDYSRFLEPFYDNYDTVTFKNGNKYRSLDIDASINKYDIVKDLGEQNIYNTVSKEYAEWLKTSECVWEETPGVEEYMKKYISDLKSNYKKFAKSTDFSFYDDEDIKVFAKDLKTYDGITLQYVGIMPKKVALKEYVSNIDANKLSNVISNLKEVKYDTFEEGYVTNVIGTIPMFKYNYNLSLMDDLKELGIKDVFDENKANLTLSTTPAYINSASHKSMIEFSNNGIKAASTTEMGGWGNESCGFEHLYKVPVKTIDLTFDNPYMYIIRNKDTGEVWFVGTVYEPEKAK